MRASPAAAKGTRKIKKRQATVVTSVSLGAGMGIILRPLADSDAIGKRGSIPTLPRQYQSGQTQPGKAAPRKAQSPPAQGTIPPVALGSPTSSFQNPPVQSKEACMGISNAG